MVRFLIYSNNVESLILLSFNEKKLRKYLAVSDIFRTFVLS